MTDLFAPQYNRNRHARKPFVFRVHQRRQSFAQLGDRPRHLLAHDRRRLQCRRPLKTLRGIWSLSFRGKQRSSIRRFRTGYSPRMKLRFSRSGKMKYE